MCGYFFGRGRQRVQTPEYRPRVAKGIVLEVKFLPHFSHVSVKSMMLARMIQPMNKGIPPGPSMNVAMKQPTPERMMARWILKGVHMGFRRCSKDGGVCQCSGNEVDDARNGIGSIS